MIRRATTVLLTTMAVHAMTSPAECQSVRRSNPALTTHTSDAASFDTSGRAFLQYGTGDNQGYTAEAGIATWGGMLRAIYANSYSQTVGGIGYARMLTARDAGKLGTWGLGFDLSGAMDFRHRPGVASRAASLSIPLSLRWGTPSRLSIAPYVAAYGEIGRETAYRPANCDPNLFCSYVPAGLEQTRVLGMESGLQLTVWRLGMQFGLRSVPRGPFGNSSYQGGAGIRLRF